MMLLAATLIAAPKTSPLSDALIARAAQALDTRSSLRWLAPGEAAELSFEADEVLPARDRLRAALAGAGVDIFVQAFATRAKRLLVADMDSTLIGQECIDELAAEAGFGAEVAEITNRAMNGEIAFEPALRERAALLKGLPESVIAEVIATRITLTPGARTLVQTMRARGAHTAIVSGGFTQFTSAIAAQLGAQEHRANRLLASAGKLTGEVSEPILGAQAKLDALQDMTARLGLRRSETLAVGDGANDLAMLSAAGLGAAYRAKPTVAAAAHARIDHADLTALLFVQGIERREFVEPRASSARNCL